MANPADYQPDFLLKLLEEMLLIRRFEEKAARMYGLGKIKGFCHIYIGQEAVCVGAIAAVDLAKDYVLTAYRDHGHAISIGMDPKVVMAELFGKASGCSRGKGGSMHLFDVERHFLGGNGIVAAHIPLATGVAFSIKYMSAAGVVLCFFGDGAIHQGVFHEALNMAGLWKLPIVYICENNQYAMGTDFRRVSAVTDFDLLASSYDMPGEAINGMDVLEVHKKVQDAVELARSEQQPTLIEARTYRYMGHSMSDAAKYRTKDEVQQQKQQDPILILKKRLASQGVLDDQQYEDIDARCKDIVAAAVEFAESSQPPAKEILYEDVLI